MKKNINILKFLCESLRAFASLCGKVFIQSSSKPIEINQKSLIKKTCNIGNLLPSKIVNLQSTIILLFLTANVVFSQNIISSIDSTEIKIGSQYHLIIKANVQPNDRVSFPEGQNFGQLEVLESNPIDTVKLEGKFELIKKYGLTQFDSGRYVVPPLNVIINEKTIKTDSFPIVVNNIIVDTTKQQMFDIKPIISVEKPANYW